MPLNINEEAIENLALEHLAALGWEHTDARQIEENSEFSRANPSDVIFKRILQDAVERLNPDLPEMAVADVVAQVVRVSGASLSERNQAAYQLLRNGVPVSYKQDGKTIHYNAYLIDFKTPSNNRFDMVNQLTIKGRKGNRRPDVIGFVNGLPLVVFELKNPLSDQADILDAYHQLQTYKDEIADLFVFNQALIISDFSQARLGSLTANFERFTVWRVVDEKNDSQRITFENELVGLMHGLLTPENWLNYVQNFVVFENDDGNVIKKIAAYHQFYGVNEAVDCTLLAASPNGNRKIGVMWHTQGSGKSLSMLFYAGRLLAQPALQNPTIVVVTDRNDLDGQLFATFSAGESIIRQKPVQAEDRENLRDELAKRETGGVIFTTIQKFALLDGEQHHPMLNDRANIIVMTDEAHRTQYGFNTQIKNGQYRTGFAKYLREALPNASFIGFTGTPISQEDKDTQDVFGRYVSIYAMEDAVADGATVPIFYQALQIKLGESEQFDNVIREAEAVYDAGENARMKLMEKLVGSDGRLNLLADSIVKHFEKRCESIESKAMTVVMSRDIAVKLYQKITALRPEWHSDDVNSGALKVIMTGSASDPESLQRFVPSKDDRKLLEKRFKDPNDSLRMVIVVDMWLTGFDVPCCNTMYIDKPMKEHNLMQAIARVNRVFRNKSNENGGLIVDYIGLTAALREAAAMYGRNPTGGESVAVDIALVKQKLAENMDIIHKQFATPVKGKAFDLQEALSHTSVELLLHAINQAAEHILALDYEQKSNDKKDPTPRKTAFIRAVRSAKKGYALCGSDPAVKRFERELAFFDSIRQRIGKDTPTKTADRERQIRLVELLNQAVQSQGVVNLLDELDDHQANISLLSDEFLERVQKSGTKNLWAERIAKYLKQNFRKGAGSNITLQKTFEDKLKETMNQYHNQSLSVADVLKALIDMAKEFEEQQKRGEQLGLSYAELTFYDALIRNESAVRIMQDLVLKRLAQEITDQLQKSVTLDWKIKPAVKARMRNIIRLTLKKNGYPPDLEQEAIARVLEQAEVLGDELVG
ncbi:type I restriction endonuclease subunit R [Lonepinella sp. BR2271]|uniref:type I restriction endonuclease subunit R n=1 Tax=Lonepinella sp. BR2271 TaxID=3434550 RepID=UPI003F6E2758